MKPNKKLLSFLKQFFFQRPELHNPDDVGLLPTEQFYRLMDKERYRADRLGTPFSLIVIPLPLPYQTGEKLEELTSLIRVKTRLIDDLGWFAPGTLGIYLFNTRQEGAEILLSRIKSAFTRPEVFAQAHIMVYPDTQPRSTRDSQPLGDERRQQERVELQLSARVYPAPPRPEPDRSDAQPAQTRDISAGGAFLTTDNPLPEHTELSLEILIPAESGQEQQGEVALRSAAHVVRSVHNGIAVEFHERQTLSRLQQTESHSGKKAAAKTTTES